MSTETKQNYRKKDSVMIVPVERMASLNLFEGDGEKIRAIRKKKKLSLRATSDKLKEINHPLSYQILLAIETGQKQKVSCDNILAIAEVLGQEILDIFDIKITL